MSLDQTEMAESYNNNIKLKIVAETLVVLAEQLSAMRAQRDQALARLENLKPEDVSGTGFVLIWSREHQAWWKPDDQGDLRVCCGSGNGGGHAQVYRFGDMCPVCEAQRDRGELQRQIGRLEEQLKQALAKPKVKEFMTMRDIAAFLSCSVRAVGHYREAGLLPPDPLTPRSAVLAVVPKINALRKGRNQVVLSEAA